MSSRSRLMFSMFTASDRKVITAKRRRLVWIAISLPHIPFVAVRRNLFTIKRRASILQTPHYQSSSSYRQPKSSSSGKSSPVVPNTISSTFLNSSTSCDDTHTTDLLNSLDEDNLQRSKPSLAPLKSLRVKKVKAKSLKTTALTSFQMKTMSRMTILAEKNQAPRQFYHCPWQSRTHRRGWPWLRVAISPRLCKDALVLCAGCNMISKLLHANKQPLLPLNNKKLPPFITSTSVEDSKSKTDTFESRNVEIEGDNNLWEVWTVRRLPFNVFPCL
jgi:hypothetical protein